MSQAKIIVLMALINSARKRNGELKYAAERPLAADISAKRAKVTAAEEAVRTATQQASTESADTSADQALAKARTHLKQMEAALAAALKPLNPFNTVEHELGQTDETIPSDQATSTYLHVREAVREIEVLVRHAKEWHPAIEEAQTALAAVESEAAGQEALELAQAAVATALAPISDELSFLALLQSTLVEANAWKEERGEE